MRAIRMFNGGRAAAIAALVLPGLLLLSAGPAMARGFCNIDHLGEKKEQAMVAEAAALFYRSNALLFQALQHYETGNMQTGADLLTRKDDGVVILLQRAGQRYQAAAKAVDFKIDKRVAAMDMKMVTEAAMAGPSPILQRLFEGAQKDGARYLLTECGKTTTEMAVATDRFAKEAKETPDREAPYTRLFGEWGRVMYVGRIVSAIFGLAGEKK